MTSGMAADIREIIRNLLDFYDFRGQTVLSIGAGGGQLVEYGRQAARVTAVDSSAEALARLRAGLAGSGLENKFDLVHADFFACRQKGDALIFEFCLHEMDDAAAALRHARELARDVVVLDHLPGSDWAFYVAEEVKVARSWQALREFGLRRVACHESRQAFADFAELRLKALPMGEVALRRIEPFRGRTGFAIPMAYGLALA